jgi:uncharacterized protein YajQ (UPF0234 family)
MPSFDIVSQVDLHELTNSVDQTNREISKRFDFKGSSAHVEQTQRELAIIADVEFQVKQILDILQSKMTKRGIDIDCLELGEVVETINQTRQAVTVRHGIDKELTRKILKQIKELKLKVQAQSQQDQVRVTSKKRDDLQAVIAALKGAEFGLPLQFVNFRD